MKAGWQWTVIAIIIRLTFLAHPVYCRIVVVADYGLSRVNHCRVCLLCWWYISSGD